MNLLSPLQTRKNRFPKLRPWRANSPSGETFSTEEKSVSEKTKNKKINKIKNKISTTRCYVWERTSKLFAKQWFDNSVSSPLFLFAGPAFVVRALAMGNIKIKGKKLC